MTLERGGWALTVKASVGMIQEVHGGGEGVSILKHKFNGSGIFIG
jgi:hypothetical protein